MDGDNVCTCFGKGFKIGIGWRDHQVDIEWQIGVRAQRPDYIRTYGDVGDEMAVHHVNMNPVRASLVDLTNLLTQARKVCR